MPTQVHRIAAIGTPLGADALVLKSASIHEEMGRLFQIEADLIANDTALNFDDLIGQDATVRLDLPTGGDPRYFNGYISRFVQTENKDGYAQYHATLVPWLWFLTRTADCRIFQQMAIPDIIQMVFKDHGFNDFRNSLTATYPTLEYCVQYRETDFNFVSRLMEHAGIYYYFQHENGKHTLVLCDAISAHSPFPGFDTIEFHPVGQRGTKIGDVINWVLQKEVQTGVYALKDFDFTAPKKDLQVKSNVARQCAASDFEIYDYPGDYTVVGDGDSYAKVRIEELQADYETARGQASARGIATGCTFTLSIVTDDLRKDQGREYLVVASDHHIDVGLVESGGSPTEDHYSCSFTVMSTDEVFRSARLNPKPLIQGPQTAIVVGRSDDEIYTDQYGRVKLQFHWDRYGQADENASCWVRVSQLWAGKGWGAMHLPRVGQEVIVEFLEGDPDRPIITGRVYNGAAMPPYALPGEKTKSTNRSNSSKGGQGFNEIRFEDKKGSEQVFVHGEKDEDVRIKHDAKEWIGNDRHLIVVNNQLEQVQNDKHVGLTGDHLCQVGGDHNETVKGDHLLSIAGADNIAVTGDRKTSVGGDDSLKVSGNWNNESGNTLSVKSGADITEKAAQNVCVDAGTTVYIKAGTTMVLEAGAQLSLKVGGNFVDIGPAGVSITGTLVMINSGGAAGSGSPISPTAPVAPDPPTAPTAPKAADDATPGSVDAPATAPTPPTPVTYSATAKVLKSAADSGTPFCEECEKAKQQQQDAAAAGSASAGGSES